MPHRISPSLIVSGIALVLAAGGIGVGAGAFITGADIEDGSITGADIRDGSITSSELARGAVTKSRMAPGARLALRKAGTRGPAGQRGPAGAQGVAGPGGARGDTGPPGAAGSGAGGGAGFAETFTRAAPIVKNSGEPPTAFSMDQPVAWTTPAGSVDVAYVSVQADAGPCTGDLRLGFSRSVDGGPANFWDNQQLWFAANTSSNFATDLAMVGPGAHTISSLQLVMAASTCTVTVSDITINVARMG